MGYRVLTVLMITFLVTGFGWGKKEETTKKKTEQSSSYVATPASKPSSASSTTSSTNSYKAQSTVSSGEEQFPTGLISTIASGDEDTRKARIDSLKRLSQALSEMKNDGGNTANTETAPATSETPSNSTYPWGNY